MSPVSVEVFSMPSKAFGMAAEDRVSAFPIEAPSRRSRSLTGRRRVEVEWLLLNTRSRFFKAVGLEKASMIHAITLAEGQEKMGGNRRIAGSKGNSLKRSCRRNSSNAAAVTLPKTLRAHLGAQEE